MSLLVEQQRLASAGVRDRQPDKALLSFCASMEQLCSVVGPLLNHINLSAVITATALRHLQWYSLAYLLNARPVGLHAKLQLLNC